MGQCVGKMDSGCHNSVCVPLTKCLKTTPRSLITATWFITSILVFVAFIVGCVVAAANPLKDVDKKNGTKVDDDEVEVANQADDPLRFAAVRVAVLRRC